ncbi:hypothetical protein ACF1E9_30795 [Streptomyces roseolus]|uniref:hypothetical protein n=1 Tax=Streptomyces roseolus TaxID=67358 RepID=UPI0036F98D78
MVTVCAEDGSSTGGGGAAPAGTGSKANAGEGESGSSGPTCTYEKLNPQPSRGDNTYWRGHEREAGAVYGVTCPGSNSARAIFIPDAADVPAPGEPVIDPAVLARRAVDSMRLDGPRACLTNDLGWVRGARG